ncbi:MAG: Mov34/MPN/PAD-1 family protein [Candidatus Bathyarchaeia archaeon]
MDKAVLIERTVVDSILSYAQMLHPREAILLLKGKVDKHRIVVNDTQIPPLATHGNTFSTFPLYTLPIDFSIVGVAHSHPSGALRPSVTDLNKFYGRIMVITAYPYRSEKNIAIFDREGKPLKYGIV